MVDSWPFAGLIRTILGVLPLFSATIRSPGFANVTAGTANAAATSSSVPSVSVPVLSTQIVSTAASASVALIC